MSTSGSDYTVTMQPMWCARTGEFLFEPTHPRLEEVLVCILRKWAWSNRDDLPDALTLFYFDFEVERKSTDDFQCLGDLMLGRPLAHYVHRKGPSEAQHQAQEISGRCNWTAAAQTPLVTPESVSPAAPAGRSKRELD